MMLAPGSVMRQTLRIFEPAETDDAHGGKATATTNRFLGIVRGRIVPRVTPVQFLFDQTDIEAEADAVLDARVVAITTRTLVEGPDKKLWSISSLANHGSFVQCSLVRKKLPWAKQS